MIAIIDSGIDPNHKRLKNHKISGINIVTKGEMANDYMDNLGHGTACASIITSLMPKVELYIVKIFDGVFKTSELSLIDAIKHCIEIDKVKIINISSGITTNQPSAELTNICRKAYEKNKIIVAAYDNNANMISYPAHFP